MKQPRLIKHNLLIIAALVLTIVGLLGVIPGLYYRWTGSGTAHASAGPFINTTTPKVQPAAVQPVQVSGYPDNITVQLPSTTLNLQVVPGVYNPTTKAWNVSLTQAQYATPSVLPNNLSGNTLIYGHYRPEVFAYLHLIKPGALATVATSNGYTFTYQYVGTYAMQPNDTSIFNYTGAPILTVQTCSGSYFQNRQMYQFNFVSYQKA